MTDSRLPLGRRRPPVWRRWPLAALSLRTAVESIDDALSEIPPNAPARRYALVARRAAERAMTECVGDATKREGPMT